MKKKIALFAVLLLSALLFTTSCNNVFESSTDDYEYDEKKAEQAAEKAKKSKEAEQKKQEPEAPKIRYATLSGDLALDGAYPLSIKKKV